MTWNPYNLDDPQQCVEEAMVEELLNHSLGPDCLGTSEDFVVFTVDASVEIVKDQEECQREEASFLDDWTSPYGCKCSY